MVWLALGTVYATAAVLAAMRWRSAYGQSPLRWAAALVALLIAFSVLFVDAAREKAAAYYPPHTTVGDTLKHDPRIALWEYTAGRIRERPWTGHGFGRTILAPEMRAALKDPLLTHAHNVFVSQWLQTGAIGAALFVALLASLAWRYAALLRARDDALAFAGLVGLALLAGFVVKNLTDDFLFRSNAKEFFALNALLLGFAAWRTRDAADAAVARARTGVARLNGADQRRRGPRRGSGTAPSPSVVSVGIGATGAPAGGMYSGIQVFRRARTSASSAARSRSHQTTICPTALLLASRARATNSFGCVVGSVSSSDASGSSYSFSPGRSPVNTIGDLVRVGAGQPDHVARQVDDAHRLAHVEHEDLAALAHAGPPAAPAAPPPEST